MTAKTRSILSRAIVQLTLTMAVLLLCLQNDAHAQASLRASVSASKNVVFLHESFSLTITVTARDVRLGQHFELQDLLAETTLKRLTGFQELTPERKQSGNSSTDTRRFTVRVRAMRSGTFTVSPRMLVGILRRRQGFFGSRMVETVEDLRISPLSLKVKPLPIAGRPRDFSGAVGQFRMKTKIIPSVIAVGDLVTASTTITGAGYLDNISAPRLTVGRHFKVYDPRSIAHTEDKSVAFEQIVIPQNTNAAAISSISFIHFDPNTGSYATLSQGPFPLSFRAPEKITIEQFRPADTDTGKPMRPLGTDPHAVRTEGPSSNATARARPWMEKGHGSFARITVREKARIAPSRSAKVTFEVGAGTDTEVVEVYRDWSKIMTKNARGWIPSDSIQVKPAQ
jgi:hypothetical protein